MGAHAEAAAGVAFRRQAQSTHRPGHAFRCNAISYSEIISIYLITTTATISNLLRNTMSSSDTVRPKEKVQTECTKEKPSFWAKRETAAAPRELQSGISRRLELQWGRVSPGTGAPAPWGPRPNAAQASCHLLTTESQSVRGFQSQED